jgi:hypothetical protein
MRMRSLIAIVLAAGAVAAGCGSTVTLTSEKAWSGPPLPPKPHVSKALRAQINQTLDVFVRDAVERHNPSRAYAVASPMMRSSQTRAEWNAGTLPVAPYQTRGKTFHQYTLMAVEPRQVSMTMILKPRHPKTQGAVAYNVRVSRCGARWCVDWFTPTAYFASASETPGIKAEPDLAPSAGAATLDPKRHADLIMLGVLAVMCIPLVVGLGFFLRSLRRRRRLLIGPSPDDKRWDEALRGS